MNNMLLTVLDNAVIIPAAIFCMWPVKRYLVWKMSFVKFQALTILGLCLWTVGMSLVEVFGVLSVSPTIPGTIFFCLLLFTCSFNVRKQALLYIFSCAVCLFSFSGITSYLAMGWVYPKNPTMAPAWGTGVQWIFILLIMGTYCLVTYRQLTWLIDHCRQQNLWGLMCVPPMLIALCNMMFIPKDITNMQVGRILEIGIAAELTLLTLFILFQSSFYVIARQTCDQDMARQEHQLLEMQHRQLAVQQSYIQKVRHMRHDVKHSLTTAAALFREGKYEELDAYLKEYALVLDRAERYQEFCSLPAVNALLNEYVAQCEKHEIHLQVQVDMTHALHFPETELCILLGNLLENAVRACRSLPAEQRYIRLSADAESPQQLFILVHNSFDGRLSWQDGLPVANYDEHFGLSSIQAIAASHHGMAKFYAEGQEFRAEVMVETEPTK